MADAKISALTNLTAADPTNDMIPIVDVSDTPPASGNTKRISINNILSSSPTASGALTVTGLVTAGSATITGAATVGTTLGVTGVSTFAAGTALLPALTTTGDTNTGIYYPAADTFAVTTAGVERYRVDSTGLTIGGTALGKFTAYSTTNGDVIGVFRCTGTGTQRGLYISADNSTGVVSLDSSGAAGGSLQFKSGGTNTMLIDSSGNTTIGTSGGSGLFRVNSSADGVIGQFRRLGATNNIGLFVSSTEATQEVTLNATGSGGSPYFAFQIAGVEKMRLDLNGNLILQSSSTPATLGTNGMLTVNATSNTNLRFSYRGSDGTTRVANLTLA